MTILGHFARIHVTWSGPDLGISDCQGFDQRAAQIINGDDGGCWAPETEIIISGTTFGLQLTGALTVWGPGGTLTTSGTSRFHCNVGTYPQLGPTHSGRSRSLKSSFLTARAIPWSQWLPHTGSGGAHYDGKMQSVALTTQTAGADPVPTTIFAPIEVHNGGTLSSVDISFAVSQSHSSVPTLPKARVLQVDTSGNVTPMTSVAAGADADGYVSMPTPATAAAYYNNGAVQSWNVSCDTDNVVDTSQYYYLVEIVEEQNGTVTPVLAPVDLVTNSQQFQGELIGTLGTIDGVSPTAGMRVLLKDQIDPATNGVYYLPSPPDGSPGVVGVWTRPADFRNGSTQPTGLQIPVKTTGLALGGSTFVMSSPSGSAVVSIGNTVWVAGETYVVGQTVTPFLPNGFVYQCTTAGTTNSSTEPTWPNTIGTKTATDGTAVWTCVSTDNRAAMYFSPLGNPTVQAPPTWLPSHAYAANGVVSPSVPNGFVFFIVAGFTSASTEPAWVLGAGQVTTTGPGQYVAYPVGYNQFTPATPQGNIWNDLTANMTNISSLAFQ